MLDSIIFGVLLAIMLYCWHIDKQQMKDEREAWAKERKDLMDRVQASSFAEYSNKVIREKIAEQPKEEPTYDEFVS